jgi:mannose-6-phosphate isomerase-like protein (cupin superfamily)
MRISGHASKVSKSNNGMRTAVLDLAAETGINSPSNRQLLANFLELNIANLPANFDQATKITSIGKHQAAVIVDAAASNDIYCCVAMTHAKDFGPPVHIHHNEDEYFLILEGHYIYQVDNNLVELKAGDLLFAPKGVPHAFRCLSEEGRTLVFTKPAGFERYFSEVAQLPAENFKEGILELNKEFGIEFTGKPIDPSVKFWE